jgi:cell division protein FtsZ
MIEFEDNTTNGPRIKVIGVGGGGGNAINNMIDRGIAGVDFLVANTDSQALDIAKAPTKLQLGQGSTKGLGAGAKPDVGAGAAKESIDRIEELVHSADMVFVAAGMGGGTGTGAAPIIADVARRQGALTVGVVTKPFAFEGNRRRKQAERGIEALKAAVDTLIIVPNDRLLSLCSQETSMLDAFKMADQVLFNAVKGISDIITQQGVINVDFADAQSVMSAQGLALMGIGRGTGEKRALDAAHAAISSPLLEEVSIKGATGILVNVTGGPSLTLHEVNAAIALITSEAHEDANIIFGYVVDEAMGEDVAITVIATGFEKARREQMDPSTANTRAPQAAQQRTDPDVPTYIRNGWRDGKPMRGALPQAELPMPMEPAPVAEPAYEAAPAYAQASPLAMAANGGGGPGLAPTIAQPQQAVAHAAQAAAALAQPSPLAQQAVHAAQHAHQHAPAPMQAALQGAMQAPSIAHYGVHNSLEPIPSASMPAHAAQPMGAQTPRRGVIALLPPVEDENPRPPKRSVHREAALAMSSALGEDDEYDIPAFLRRNAE